MTPAGKPGQDLQWPADLLASVRQLPSHSHLYVALSGGLDSVLLLHAVARLYPGSDRLAAIHVNHQLQNNAAETAAFCEHLCDSLGVRFIGLNVEVPANHPDTETGTGGLEEAARNARYQAFENCLGDNDLLLLAHHQDDQLETLLFRIFRGSGIAGLSGMPVSRPLGRGQLYRPLLGFSRLQLERWASELSFDWVEDPSNQDQRFDRNFLRHRIIPALKERWPTLDRRLAATASACEESNQLNIRLAELQYEGCRADGGTLSLDSLRQLSVMEQKNLIRWWVGRQFYSPPNPADWTQLMAEFLDSAADRQPEFRGEGYSLRRYQSRLCLVPAELDLGEPDLLLSVDQETDWGSWRLSLKSTAKDPGPSPRLKVTRRVGGERLRVCENGPSKSLKNWLQEQKVPSWERGGLPLVLDLGGKESELVAVGDLWVSERYSGHAPASGWSLIVERDSN